MPRHPDVLASSADCLVEPISDQDRPHLLGLQFDNHADPWDMATWMKWLASLPAALAPASILREAHEPQAPLAHGFRILLTNSFALLGCLWPADTAMRR